MITPSCSLKLWEACNILSYYFHLLIDGFLFTMFKRSVKLLVLEQN
uniref:Uncharacterized protein n=1 Tax=Rhizophora mucronata TaxID=61149 RepID=A0A2P2KYJ0_RHIMU